MIISTNKQWLFLTAKSQNQHAFTSNRKLSKRAFF